jgi:hypothetical protein
MWSDFTQKFQNLDLIELGNRLVNYNNRQYQF